MRYDPAKTPDPAAWLALDESSRADAVEKYHRQSREKVPNVGMHAMFHVIVENQIAEGVEAVVRTMSRLRADGLSRHDAVHAVGSVLAENISDLMQGEVVPGNLQKDYEAALERLNAKQWRKDYGGQ